MRGKNTKRASRRSRVIIRMDVKDLTDWDKVKSMTDEEIERNALSDPDALPFDDDWDNAVIVYPEGKPVPTNG